MTGQTNIDYLFQVTAQLVERAAAVPDSGASDRAEFEEHLAQASESARGGTAPRQRESSGEYPASSSYAPATAAEPDAEEAPRTDNRHASCESCEDSSLSAESSDNASESSDGPAPSEQAGETPNSEPDGETSAKSAGEDAREANGEDAEELTDELAALGAVVEGNVDSAAAAEVVPGDLALQVDQSGDGATAPPPGAEQNELARQPAAASSGIPGGIESATEVAAAVEPASQPALHENVARGVQPNIANNSTKAAGPVTNDASASTAPAEVARDETASTPQHPTAGKDFGASSHAAPIAGSAPPKVAKASAGSRRGSDKNNRVDDARHRASDGADRQSSQRTDSASNGAATAAAIVTPTVRDAAAPAAARSNDETAATGTRQASAKIDGLPHVLGRSDRAHSAAKRGPANLPRVDAARFVGRVTKAIHTATQRGGSLQLRLSPPELGSLRLELSVQNGVMSATLEAESPVARQVLLDHLPALRDRLAEQNIRIDRFDVDVRQEGSGGQADPRASQQEQRGQHPQHPMPRRDAVGGVSRDDVIRESIVVPAPAANGGINMLA